MKTIQFAIALAALAWLAGCAVKTAPQPPSLELPRPVQDLKAARKGDRVSLLWTPPRETTDRAAIRQMGSTRICRAVGVQAPSECADVVGEVPASQLPKGNEPATFTDTLPQQIQQQNPAGFAAYNVEIQNARGRSAGLSNAVQVPLAPTLPAPADLRAQVTPAGVQLTWTGVLHQHELDAMRHLYRIYRRVKGTPGDVVVGEVTLTTEQAAGYLDANVEWETTYEYWATVVTIVPQEKQAIAIEGDNSPVIEAVVHDVFPPATPTGVEAVFTPGTPGFVDLTWAPNAESDLAGYNVYRREENGQPTKISEQLSKAPAFRDAKVEPGRRYYYSVSAVDLRGNESARSEEAGEASPQ